MDTEELDALLGEFDETPPEAPLVKTAEQPNEETKVLVESQETPAENETPPEEDFSVLNLSDTSSAELDDFFEASGLQTQTKDPVRVRQEDLYFPWMRFHRFTLVRTVEEVTEIVNAFISNGRGALDLECEGLDNRINFDADDRPSTVHRIVGYCISVRGHGYYIPVRHAYNPDYDDQNPNVEPKAVEAEIKRLCLAAQPQEHNADDPLYGPPVKGGLTKICFWNAKFDQEYLYPITGIDVWHPDSFDDGMLAAYAWYTDDSLNLKEKAEQFLSISADGVNFVPYRMIHFTHLFPKGMKQNDMKFANLYPEPDSPMVRYGCSDGICTEILCAEKDGIDLWDYLNVPAAVKYQSMLTRLDTEPKRNFRNSYQLELRTAQAVRTMERPRVPINRAEAQPLKAEAEQELEQYRAKIQQAAKLKGCLNLNPGSTEQLSNFLFGETGLDLKPKPPKNDKGYTCDAKVLEGLVEQHPDLPGIEIVEWVLKYRALEKIVGTYLTSLDQDVDASNKIRLNFRQTGAATGRFTAPGGEPEQGFTKMPIHGIPAKEDPKKPKAARSLRRLFVSSPGYVMVKIDYSAQELRIVTNTSKEPLWIKEFKTGTGDLHTLTAQAFFGPHITKDNKIERGMGKTANFALVYGGGVGAVMRATKCDKATAQARKEAFDKSVPTFAKWVETQKARVKKDLGVFDAFGRFIRIPDANIKSNELFDQRCADLKAKGQDFDPPTLRKECEADARMIRAGCERKAVNFPIQGAGATVLKIALTRLQRELWKRGWLKTNGDDSVRMLMTVHDEIVFEVKLERLQEAVPVLREIMESPTQLARWDIPLVAEPQVGLNWVAPYDWESLIHGKIPLPDFLVGYVVPKQEHVPKPKEETKIQPTPEAPKAERDRHERIGVFSLNRSVLTPQSVNLVRQAIVRASPAGSDPLINGFRLHLVETNGEDLIVPEDGVYILLDKFAEALQEMNLGPGVYRLE